MAIVHLLRHGEVHNPEKILYGRLEGYRLSELGRRMAKAAAEYFGERTADGARITRVIASPLLRAQQTAEPIAGMLDLNLETEPRIIESENHFEGLRMDREELRKPKHWPYLINPTRPSWGEPYKKQVRRMAAAVQDARMGAEQIAGPDAEAVLVSHQLPIWVTRLSAEGRKLWHDPRERECELASVTSLHFTDGKITAIEYNEPAAALYSGASQLPGA